MALVPNDPRPGTQEFLERLFQSARPLHRGEEVVTRGRQRPPLLLVQPPAYATATSHTIRLVGEVAQHRDLATRWPEAFRVQYSEDLKVIIWTPEERFNPEDPQLMQVRWRDSNRRMTVNLLDILQPRRMTVPRGTIMEIPVMAVELPGQGAVLLCLLIQHRVRPIRSRKPAAPPAVPPAAVREAAAGRQPAAEPPAPAPAGAPEEEADEG